MTAKEQNDRAQAVKAMTATTGWEIIEGDLLAEVNHKMSKLLETDDTAVLRTVQLEVRAVKRLLNKVKSYTDMVG